LRDLVVLELAEVQFLDKIRWSANWVSTVGFSRGGDESPERTAVGVMKVRRAAKPVCCRATRANAWRCVRLAASSGNAAWRSYRGPDGLRKHGVDVDGVGACNGSSGVMLWFFQQADDEPPGHKQLA
jgi:hypothetical protein